MSQQYITGRSVLQQEIKVVEERVTEKIQVVYERINDAIDEALDVIFQDGQIVGYQNKPLNEISNIRKNTGNIDMNNFRIENMSTVPDLSSIEAILATPNTAVNVSTMSTYSSLYTAAQLLLNTAYCGPLSSEMSVKDKRVTNMADLQKITENDTPQQVQSKIKQGVNLGSLNGLTLSLTVPVQNPPYLNTEQFSSKMIKIIELGDATIYKDSDLQMPDPIVPGDTILDETKQLYMLTQAMNLKQVQNLAICLDTKDRNYFDADDKQIRNLNIDTLTNTDHNQYDDFLDNGTPLTPELISKLSQATDIKYGLEHFLHIKQRDQTDTSAQIQDTAYDALYNNIQHGKKAILNDDFVIKEQTIVQEEAQLQYEFAGVVTSGPFRHIDLGDANTVYTCNDPKMGSVLGQQIQEFTVKDSNPEQKVNRNRQLANLKYVDGKVEEEVKKRHSKTEDIDLDSTYYVKNMPDPTAYHHGVNKSYCDSNSGKDTGGTSGGVLGFLGGIISGAISGFVSSLYSQGIASALGAIANQGLAAMGQFANNMFNGGMRIGSSSDLDKLKTNNPIQNEGPLIDNLKDDIANREPGQPDSGNLLTGATSINGLLSSRSNSLIGLFELAAN